MPDPEGHRFSFLVNFTNIPARSGDTASLAVHAEGNQMILSTERFVQGQNRLQELFSLMDRGDELSDCRFQSDKPLLLPRPLVIPEEFRMSTDNPGAEVQFSGFHARELHHDLRYSAVYAAMCLSHHQTTADAYAGVHLFGQLKVGDRFLARMHTDEFGAPGMSVVKGFDKRFGGTLKGLMPISGRARHQSVDMSHLTELDVFANMLGAMQHGVRFSWNIVRHKLSPLFPDGKLDYLFFFPTEFPGHGCEAMDLIGDTVDPRSFTPESPFDPDVIYVCLPWMSHQEFGPEDYTIAVAKGRKRLFIANFGPYAGGCKKPGNCQKCESELPEVGYVMRHWSIGGLANGDDVAKGDGTAVGKTEVTAPESVLGDEPVLVFTDPVSGAEIVRVDISADSPILADNPLATPDSELQERMERSDDLSGVECAPAALIGEHARHAAAALAAEKRLAPDGKYSAPLCDSGGRILPPVYQSMRGLNGENMTYRRTDLETGRGEEPLVHLFVDGKLPRDRRRYFFQFEFNSDTRRFIPGRYRLIDPTTGEYRDDIEPSPNPRLTHDNDAGIPGHRPATIEDPANIRTIIKALSAPNVEGGFWLPPFVRLNVRQYEAHDRDCRRDNRSNPAMAPVGQTAWIKEGPAGMRYFTVDRDADVAVRGQQFYRSISRGMPIWLVSEYYCAGLKQKFKYSGTFFWRFIWERFRDRLICAPLIKLPGITTGFVPDLDWVVGEGRIPRPPLASGRVRSGNARSLLSGSRQVGT